MAAITMNDLKECAQAFVTKAGVELDLDKWENLRKVLSDISADVYRFRHTSYELVGDSYLKAKAKTESGSDSGDSGNTGDGGNTQNGDGPVDDDV